MKVVKDSSSAKDFITLPKLQLSSFVKSSKDASEQEDGGIFSSSYSASLKNSRGFHIREMSFDPNGVSVATPRVEDVQHLVPKLNNVILAPIGRRNFLDREAAKRNARQQRQSFIISGKPQTLSPIPSSDTASISSMSPLSIETREEQET